MHVRLSKSILDALSDIPIFCLFFLHSFAFSVFFFFDLLALRSANPVTNAAVNHNPISLLSHPIHPLSFTPGKV